MTPKNPLERVAFSPGEFAELFGKSQTWGYRQIYKGNVNAITEYGRRLIPASEVERILQTAGVFDGVKPKKAKTKSEIQRLAAPKLLNAWQSFLARRRQQPAPTAKNSLPPIATKAKWPSAPSGRKVALDRLTGRSGNTPSR